MHLSLIGEKFCLRSGALKASAPQVVPLRLVITSGFPSLCFFDNCLTIGVLDIPKRKKMCAHWRSQNECPPSSCGIIFLVSPSVTVREKISVATISCCSFVRKAQKCPYLGFLGERFVCTIGAVVGQMWARARDGCTWRS